MEMHHNGLTWQTLKSEVPAPDIAWMVGIIPTFLHVLDKRPAAEQIMESYIGGWDNFKGFELDKSTFALKYPEDPPMLPVVKCELPNGEQVFVYPYGWTMILQPDGETFEVARLD